MRCLLALLLATTGLAADADDVAIPEPIAGDLVAGRDLEDPDFGVRVAALALERRVQMYQWHRRGDGAYEPAWSDRPAGAGEHDAAHANPPWPAIGSARWHNEQALLAGRLVDPALFAGLDGWQPLAVRASSLPSNLAVSFGDDGGGLTSSVDPAAPEIGDLRLRWFSLPGGPVQGRAVEREGRWLAAGAGTGLQRGLPVSSDATSEVPGLDRGPRLKPVWLLWIAGAFALLAVGLYLRRKH